MRDYGADRDWGAWRARQEPQPPDKPAFGASAHVEAPEPPREKVVGAREIIALRATHGDSFSVIESTPSALPVFSGVPYLLIRGAPPSGTATIYDGAPIPAFHHLALGPAIAHLSLVSSVRFHAGVSPARYGRHIGGVHVLEAPDVAPRDTNLELELNAVDSQAIGTTHGARWVAAHARYGYPSIWLDAIGAGVKLGYGDYQLRMVTPFGADAITSVHAYGSYDSLGESGQPQDDIVLSFHRLVGRFVHRARDVEIGAVLYAGYDRGELGQELTGSTLRFGPSIYVEHVVDPNTRLRIGADMESKLADIDQREDVSAMMMVDRDNDGSSDERTPDDYLPQQQGTPVIAAGPEEFIDQSPLRETLARSAAGAFIELDFFRTRMFRLETGVRTDLWVLGDYHAHAVDPRGVLRFVPSGVLELHVGIGTAHQSVASPLPVPGLADIELDTGLQRAIQSELGVSFPDLLGVELEITGYYHRFSEVAFLELVLDCEGNTDPDVFDERLTDFQSICRGEGLPRADGENYGVELLARPRWSKRLTGFATYTLGGASARAEDGTASSPSPVRKRNARRLRLLCRFAGQAPAMRPQGAVTPFDFSQAFSSGGDSLPRSFAPSLVSYAFAPSRRRRLPRHSERDVSREADQARLSSIERSVRS